MSLCNANAGCMYRAKISSLDLHFKDTVMPARLAALRTYTGVQARAALQVSRVPEAGLAVTVGHRTNSGQSCNVSGQKCYLSGHKWTRKPWVKNMATKCPVNLEALLRALWGIQARAIQSSTRCSGCLRCPDYRTALQVSRRVRGVQTARAFDPVEHIPLFHSTIPFHHSSPVIVDYRVARPAYCAQNFCMFASCNYVAISSCNYTRRIVAQK